MDQRTKDIISISATEKDAGMIMKMYESCLDSICKEFSHIEMTRDEYDKALGAYVHFLFEITGPGPKMTLSQCRGIITVARDYLMIALRNLPIPKKQ